MNKKFLSVFIALTLSAIIFVSCSKDSSNDSSKLEIRLTDAPAAYSAINIDIRSVRVKFSDDSTNADNWVDLTTNAHVYNLLNFQNGLDTSLASGMVHTETVRQIRFVLGPNNTVVENGVTYPLQLSSQDESGLKINVSKKLNASLETVIIDFDAAQSVIKQGNGTYRLKPVLKLK